jgi:hypothetical protein
VGLNNWIAEEIMKAFFDRLQKAPVRLSGLDKTRDLVIWASEKTKTGNDTPKKG